MSEIPEDIWQAADVAASEYWFGDHLSGRAKSIIAIAILAERERCAKAADDYETVSHPRLSPGSEMNAWWSGQEAAATKIAEAIRNQNA